jgi:hypothetical protein
VTHGHPFKMSQVFGNVPRHATVGADDPVLIASHYQA